MPFRAVKLTGDTGNLNITGISLIAPTGQTTATSLAVDLKGYPNLQTFSSVNNGLEQIKGYSGLTKLTSLICRDAVLTQTSLESFANNTALTTFELNSISGSKTNANLTGNLPDFSKNTLLKFLVIVGTNYTATSLNFSVNTALTYLALFNNSLACPFPTLPPTLTVLDISRNNFTGTIPSLSHLTNVTYLGIGVNYTLTGSLPSLAANTKLLTFYGAFLTGITGDIPSLATNTVLATFNIGYSGGITGFAGGAIPASLSNFNAAACSLTAVAVNAILAAFVAAGRTGAGTINIGTGANAAPTGQGITDKATLVSRGWTVTTN